MKYEQVLKKLKPGVKVVECSPEQLTLSQIGTHIRIRESYMNSNFINEEYHILVNTHLKPNIYRFWRNK